MMRISLHLDRAPHSMLDYDARGISVQHICRAVKIRQARDDVRRRAHRRNEPSSRRPKIASVKSGHRKSRRHQLDHSSTILRRGQGFRQSRKFLRRARDEHRIVRQFL